MCYLVILTSLYKYQQAVEHFKTHKYTAQLLCCLILKGYVSWFVGQQGYSVNYLSLFPKFCNEK